MSEYGAINYGDISTYLSNKQSKLNNQNDKDFTVKSNLFSGLKLHVNGYTNPSLSQLRRIIIENGGVYLHYLNNKSDVTHIISNNLTPRKIIQFKNIKCCTPKWLLDSLSHRSLLPWQNYMLISDHSQRKIFTNNSPNKHTESLLQSEQWRQQNTAQSDSFLESYYSNSRLHFLSSGKASLKELVGCAQRSVDEGGETVQAEGDQGTQHTHDTHQSRTIFHVDMDSFFVSASLSLPKHSHLRESPVAISHSSSSSHASTSELASVNYKARERGVRNGMVKSTALALCPTLITLPYDFTLYNAITVQLYTILLRNCARVEAVSVDEALLEMEVKVVEGGRENGSGIAPSHLPTAHSVAIKIRAEIQSLTRCTASVGIGSSILLAKLATRQAKPNGIFHLHDHLATNFLAPLPFDALPGVGGETARKLQALNAETIGDLLARVRLGDVQRVLGQKKGEMIWNYAHGIDTRPLKLANETHNHKRQSVSAEVNYGIRFEGVDETRRFFTNLANELGRRLKANKCRGGQLTVKLMVRSKDAPKEPAKFLGHGVVDNLSRSAPLASGNKADVGAGRSGKGNADCTDDPAIIAQCAWHIFSSLAIDVRELRGIGFQVGKLFHDGVDDASRKKEIVIERNKDKETEKGKGKEGIESFFKKPSHRSSAIAQPSTSSTSSSASTETNAVSDVIDISSDVDESSSDNLGQLQVPKLHTPHTSYTPHSRHIPSSTFTSTSDDSINSTTTMPTQADRTVWKAIPRSIRKEVLDERARVQNALRTPFKVPFKRGEKGEKGEKEKALAQEKKKKREKKMEMEQGKEKAQTDVGRIDSGDDDDDMAQAVSVNHPSLDPDPDLEQHRRVGSDKHIHHNSDLSNYNNLMPTPTSSVYMLPSQADPSVWRALPSSIRNEVLSDRQALSRATNKRVRVHVSPEAGVEGEGEAASNSNSTSTPSSDRTAHTQHSSHTPLLTPSVHLKPTQADAEVWRALPSSIRKEILGEREEQEKEKQKQKEQTTSIASDTLPSPSLVAPNSQIDGAVWRELPPSVRRNLFEEMREERGEGRGREEQEKRDQEKQRKKQRMEKTHNTYTEHPTITHKSNMKAQRSKAAVLMHRVDMGDIVSVVEQWLDTFHTQGPLARDVDRIKLYMQKSLTEDTEGMAKTRVLLKMWKRKQAEWVYGSEVDAVAVDSLWQHAFDDVKQCVDEIVMSKWGCRLSVK
ncbi:hypothetical protein E3P77_00083 [Wallemia ichthyophaga]|nr:hypothetical protein E3P77_00083 [Wallemia ichthyophaga]